MHCCNINKSRRGDFFGSPGMSVMCEEHDKDNDNAADGGDVDNTYPFIRAWCNLL